MYQMNTNKLAKKMPNYGRPYLKRIFLLWKECKKAATPKDLMVVDFHPSWMNQRMYFMIGMLGKF